MQNSKTVTHAIVRPFGLIAAACGLLATTACAGDVGESGSADTGEITANTSDALVGGHTSLPWRGAPSRDVPPFTNGNEVIAGGNVGVSLVCTGRPQICVRAVTGLQLFFYNTITGGTRTAAVGKTSADTWTRELCANNTFVSGYNIGIVKGPTGNPLIGKFGFRCRAFNRAETNLPLLGGGDVLIPEILDCTPNTTSILSFVDGIQMNVAGDGIGANCDQT